MRKYGGAPEYPWMRFPDYAVFRHADSGKWYALVMDVPRKKLGLPGEGPAEVARTMEEIAALGPDSLTVHALAVKRASRLKMENGIPVP